jgi:hypothetical protein
MISTLGEESSGASDLVEVLTRIPHVRTRVTVSITVEPPRSEGTGDAPSDTLPAQRALSIAGGRKLPDLLFLTGRETLSLNIGEAETASLLQSIRDAGYRLVDTVPAGAAGAAEVRALLLPHLDPRPHGIVIIGGYDVVPSQRVNVLDQSLVGRVSAGQDADGWIVWSDDTYADVDGDGLPELPVSRIPDGKSSELVLAAMAAPGGSVGRDRSGVRNARRPFAEEVYAALPGADLMAASEPTLYSHFPPQTLAADRVYLMLHGASYDGTRFWGETTQPGNAYPEAINLHTVPARCGPIVFTGCCWGALAADVTASQPVPPGGTVRPRVPDNSLALSFLARGVTAFIGCTGAHYSPTAPPFTYFGAPLHMAFWRRYSAGAGPADALFGARREFAQGIPHGQTTALAQAIEKKILQEYTCLGLGW